MSGNSTITSSYVPLRLDDVDTDMIIPARHLRRTATTGYGPFVFENLRNADPHFPIGDPSYAGAEIIVAGNNFGCGSSREHAVWALKEAGFRAIIAESFADIFQNNAGKNGLLLIPLNRASIESLWNADTTMRRSGPILTIDVAQQTISCPLFNAPLSFPCDPFRKHCLLHGYSDLEYLQAHCDEIRRFFETADTRRHLRLPGRITREE